MDGRIDPLVKRTVRIPASLDQWLTQSAESLGYESQSELIRVWLTSLYTEAHTTKLLNPSNPQLHYRYPEK